MAFVHFVSAVWRKQVWNKVLPPAVSEHSDCQISKHQVQLCPPTCLTCRDPCQAGPEFTQMLIRTDPESTGITSHMWWNGGNCFLSLHYTHQRADSCGFIERFMTAFINCKIKVWFVFSFPMRKHGVALGN